MRATETNANLIVKAAQSGDRDAATHLIEIHYRGIYAFLRRLVSCNEDAGDLTQRTFSRIWKALPTYEARSSVSSWMHGIAYHVYVDWRRANRLTESQSDQWWLDSPAPERSLAESVADADLRHRVYALVDKFEPELRESVHLHYYQELSLEETAIAMTVATSTVKYRLRQALSKLQDALKAEANLETTKP